MIEEFKKFIMRGNVMDMSVGIVIGASFTSIVDSFVTDILMPVLGFLTSGMNFNNIFLTLKDGTETAGPYATLAAAKEAGAITLNVGLFINATVAFLIVSLAVFMMVKVVGTLYKKKEAGAVARPKQEQFLEEIRDLLKRK